ncbi:MAG: iron-containing alcohol dehydrogenase, partial [Candidatus Izemoplasmatales bacterium]|nr:iron-containing alcohol dehydrogenase [Candidatus Izemoplasmatales bacterium]
MDHVKDFHFWSPTEFVFGRNSEARVGEMLKRYDAKNVLIHYGGGSVVRSGLFDAIITQLDLEGISYVV